MRQSVAMGLSVPSLHVLPDSWQKGELWVVMLVVFVCCVAGAWFTLRDGSSLANNLIVSNSIGLSQYSLATLVRVACRGRLPVLGLVIVIPAGFLLGSKLAGFLGAPDVATLILRDPLRMRRAILSTVLVATVVTAFFLYFSHARSVRVALEHERRRAAEAAQAETQARLALLQAQIEPHFLFNTLANIHSLIKEDPDTASKLLEQLNVYLRTSLRRSERANTVGDELRLVEALLAIAGARLGSRLRYAVHAAQELLSLPFPALLLQPLVENAIRHGIEPALPGGEIDVDVHRIPGRLELTVKDTGVGFDLDKPGGVGLANIRARLEHLYSGNATLTIQANAPRGVIAILLLPDPGAPP